VRKTLHPWIEAVVSSAALDHIRNRSSKSVVNLSRISRHNGNNRANIV